MDKTQTETMNLDVAIMGGGLAGNLLARQLRMYVPNAKIAVFERSHERSWKVGEATVEITASYLTRRQKLSTYFYENHLPKNGLRFFFDNESKSLPLTEMSELGTNSLPYIPSFQIDRARLEKDLLQMNRDAGIPVKVGYAVRDLKLGEGGERHSFVAVGEHESIPVSARWVIDAAGRAHLIARQKQLHFPVDHEITASWARYKNVVDIDAIDDDAWRGRVRHTARYLSTVHYCYPGCWIWFIPLKEGVMSVGAVVERSRVTDEFRTKEGFLAYMKQHRTPWQLIEQAEMLDFMSYKQLAYGTKQFFSTDRWAMIGDAAAFTDPFYSPGSDFIGVENDFVTDMVRRDLAGESKEAVDERVKHYDAFMLHRFDATLLLYQHQYPFLGSYELMRAKLLFDISGYYNHWLRPYVLDEYTNLDFLKRALAKKDETIGVMKAFRELLGRAEATLREGGAYYRLNSGDAGVEFGALAPFQPTIGKPISQEETDKYTSWLLATSFGIAKDLIRLAPAQKSVEMPFVQAARQASVTL